MFLLSTDKLQITTSAAATVDVVASWVDAAQTGLTSPAGGVTPTAITTATTTDVVAAPAASTVRNIKMLTARNKHATLSCDVTVILDRSATDYEAHKVTLDPGETLEYKDGVGFYTLANAAVLDVLKVVAADVENQTTSFADITGLTQALKSGVKYAVEAFIVTTNDASTTGSRIAFNIGAAPTAALFGELGAVTNSVTAIALGGGTQTALDTAIVAQTTGQTASGMHHIMGMIQPSADGTFALRIASEVAIDNGVIVKAGSWMRIRQEG